MKKTLVLNLTDYPGTPHEQDYAGRLCNGYAEWMPDDVVFTLNRWNWTLADASIAKCDHVLFTHRRTVVSAARLTGVTDYYDTVERDPKDRSRFLPAKRRAIIGSQLSEGDPFYRKWVGEEDLPGTDNRNPVNYIDA
ncbi:hypothetical protein ACGFYZ_32050 [Streptomyces sp. NPDC048330]|uniref:hypothetical protein n=1 Tax=Streptomyces sp. NPDC048330 TaxID=3365533 RepID=UPI003717C51E